MHRALAALLLVASAPPALAGTLRGSVLYPPVHDDVDPRPEARRPLAGWRLENGKAPIAQEADVRRDVVLVLEPLQPATLDPPPLAIEARPGGALEPRIALAQLGVAVTWKNADKASRTVTLEDGDTLLPPEPAAPGATREVRFSIAGEYFFIDPEHPFARTLVVVVSTPYAARADDRGAFTLEAPDGKYRLKAWWRGRWFDVQAVEVSARSKEVVVKLPAEGPGHSGAGDAAAPAPPTPSEPAPPGAREKN